jgi:hypothetical protein
MPPSLGTRTPGTVYLTDPVITFTVVPMALADNYMNINQRMRFLLIRLEFYLLAFDIGFY